MVAVLGVDGCPGGWVGALVTLGPGAERHVEWLLLSDARAVLAVPAGTVGIDVPIGLPAGAPRGCDVEARRLLGPRRSSVFPAPVRAVLGAADYADACARSRAASGRALSLQSWNITGRIADVDATLRASPAEHLRVVEVHPELSFLRLGGRPLPPKKTSEGRRLRAAALRAWLPSGWPPPPRPARPDDALDALACAWTAQRWLARAADTLGGDLDGTGTPMRIVC